MPCWSIFTVGRGRAVCDERRLVCADRCLHCARLCPRLPLTIMPASLFQTLPMCRDGHGDMPLLAQGATSIARWIASLGFTVDANPPRRVVVPFEFGQ